MILFGKYDPTEPGWQFNGWLRRGFGLGFDFQYFGSWKESSATLTLGPFLFELCYIGKREPRD